MHRMSLLLMAGLLSFQVEAQFDTDYWYGFVVENPLAEINHAEWHEFIGRYRVIDHQTWGRRIDYAKVTPEDRQHLKHYIDRLAALDPRYYDYDQQLAYWLNLYNSLVVDLILEVRARDLNELDHLGVLGGLQNHQHIPLVSVAGRLLSLHDIQENIVLPIWQVQDLRLLFACPALDCPSLPDGAYTAASVQSHLRDAVKQYLATPGGLHLDTEGQLTLGGALEPLANHFDDPAEFVRKLAFNVDDRLALTLLGYSGRIKFSTETSIHAVLRCADGDGNHRLVYTGHPDSHDPRCEHF